MKKIKRKITLIISIALFAIGAFAPVFASGGSEGEWPCQLYLINNGGVWDLDCQGNSGNCTCILFNIQNP
ncbi:MAG: hypothetical protein CR997_02320 [Acidobacteria bacterium]|nr:MAG: hypothetical protein CR997_02320 [Acidobacteriota bacterium]